MVHRKLPLASLLVVSALLPGPLCRGIERFPPPDFQSGYELPGLDWQTTARELPAGLDIAILFAALGFGVWLALQKRSRTGTAILSVVCLLYFGFLRTGCVCPVGSVQNIAMALANASYIVPAVVIVFFLAPILVALFFGRAFCGGVCPLGAVQDLVVWKPIQVPRWLDETLRVIPWLVLALAVLYAAMQTWFPVCQLDPFVALFRFGGPMVMVVAGLVVLAAGSIVGRPYCRYFCPYGALLGLASRMSRWRLSITPDVCIHCGLCDRACPFGAINRPVSPSKRSSAGASRLRWLLPALVIVGSVVGHASGPWLAQANADVQLAKMLAVPAPDEAAVEIRAFRETGVTVEEQRTVATAVVRRFKHGGAIAGAFMGLVFALHLTGLTRPRANDDWHADPAHCVQCGRCFAFCPRERIDPSQRTSPKTGTDCHCP